MATVSEQRSASTRDGVFISYSRRDKTFVNDYLIRLLKAADVDFVIDDKDFQVGVPLEESIRKSLHECRYTLLVMTPEWVNGKWTHYEAELALQNASDNSVHILPLKVKHCDVPGDLQPRLYLDLCEARTRDNEIKRLLRQLKVPEARIDDALVSVAKKPHWFLIELLTEPNAHDEMSLAKKLLAEVQQSNEVLEIYKRLHDRLQEMQFPLEEVSKLTVARNPDQAELNDWTQAWGATSTLCEKLDLLNAFAETVLDDRVDVSFTAPFAGLAEKIETAFDSKDARWFPKYIAKASQLIDKSLPLVNDRFVQDVKRRRVNDLVQKLQTIYELVADIEFDDDVSGLMSEFRTKIDELVDLEKTIQQRVDDHGTLQRAEVELHLCSPDDDPNIDDIEMVWRDSVEPLIGRLRLTARYGSLLRCSEQLANHLEDVDSVRGDHFEKQVIFTFAKLVLEMKKSFNKLDIDLLADCGKLKPHSDALKLLLDGMQDNEKQT